MREVPPDSQALCHGGSPVVGRPTKASGSSRPAGILTPPIMWPQQCHFTSESPFSCRIAAQTNGFQIDSRARLSEKITWPLFFSSAWPATNGLKGLDTKGEK